MTLSFPSGRTADEIVVDDAAALAWVINLGCVDLNPHPVRGDDLEHPDELRVDLDPGPGVGWEDVRTVAGVVRDVLADHGFAGFPKTSGSRGIHVNVRNELPVVELAAFTIRSMPERWATAGDPGAAIDDRAFSLEPLLDLAKAQESAGEADAPWPPHYEKQEGEPARVAPSRARKKPP